MEMNITKRVDVDITVKPKDMGIAFAIAAQDEQISFIEAAVMEFNSWKPLCSDYQLIKIADKIKASEHREVIIDFIERLYEYATENVEEINNG